MKPGHTIAFPDLEIHGGGRCHCVCHRGRSPRLLDHVESAFSCDGCKYSHFEAEARERTGEFDPPAPVRRRSSPRRFGAGWSAGR